MDNNLIEYPEKLLESSNELPEVPDLEDMTCEFCEGTGEVPQMCQVYEGEGHMAPIDSRKCVCQFEEHDGDGDDD